MDWLESISKAITYIEDNISNDIETDDIANNVYMSSFYLQKDFQYYVVTQ